MLAPVLESPMPRKPRSKPDPKLAVACMRVSTTTNRQELGVEAQRAAIEAWAARAGVRIVSWHLDEASGGAPIDKRPGLLAALADLEVHHAGKLVFSKIDRFTRETMTAALVYREVQKADAEIVFADGNGSGDDPTSKLVRDILVAVGSFEKELIRARIKAALTVKKQRGELTGKAPYGYRAVPGPTRPGKDGEPRTVMVLEEDPDEQRVIGLVRKSRADGASIREIADELEAAGVRGRAGRPLTRDAVHKICQALEAKEEG